MKLHLKILAALSAMFFYFPASGEGFSFGTFHSLKGFGLCLDAETGTGIRNSFTVYADTYNVLNGKYNDPGIKAVFLHNYHLVGFSSGKAGIDLLMAPGATVGYVRDFDNGDNFGICTCADFSTSCLVCFDRGICIEFGMNIELGVLGQKAGDGIQISLYRNGVYKGYLPYVKISYRIR